jgi:DNA-damage-inducible protein J
MSAITNQKTRTNVYLDTEMKEKAKEIFKQYGMGLSDAFNIFLSQSVLERGIPFQIKIPNEDTLKAMEEVENQETHSLTFDQLQEDMKKCISN